VQLAMSHHCRLLTVLSHREGHLLQLLRAKPTRLLNWRNCLVCSG
jgi:hypothetical protein